MMVDADLARHARAGAMTRASRHRRRRVRRPVARAGRCSSGAMTSTLARRSGRSTMAPAILTADERRAVRWMHVRRARRGPRSTRCSRRRARTSSSTSPASRFRPTADDDPAATYDVNVARRRAAARRTRARGARRARSTRSIIVVGSGAAVRRARCRASMPLRESAEQRPLSVYAATKAAQEIARSRRTARRRAGRSARAASITAAPGQAPQFLLPVARARARALRARPAARRSPSGTTPVRDYLACGGRRARLSRARRARHAPARCTTSASGAGISVRRARRRCLASRGRGRRHYDRARRSCGRPTCPRSSARRRSSCDDTGWAPRKTHADIIDDCCSHAATD